MNLLSKIKRKIALANTNENNESNYIVFDLETTGLSRYYSEIIQIAAIKVLNGKVVDKYNTYVKPKKSIPKEATAINHITNEMVENAPTFKQVINSFLDFIGNSLHLFL